MREISSRVSPGRRARSESLPTEFPSRSLIFIPCSWLKKLTRLDPFVAASLTQRGPVAVIFSAMPLDVRHISPQYCRCALDRRALLFRPIHDHDLQEVFNPFNGTDAVVDDGHQLFQATRPDLEEEVVLS